jgi:pyrroline-5-carboxylate reductase
VKLSFLGNGNMANALITKLYKKFDIEVIGRDKTKLITLKKQFNTIDILTYDELKSIENKTILLCFKPNNLKEISQKLKNKGVAKNLISILAGVNIVSLNANINAKNYARVMPNVGAKIAHSCSGIYANNKNLQNLCLDIFNKVGSCVVVNNDDEIDIATAIVGSAPAFLSVVYEGIFNQGVKLGLDESKTKDFTNGLFNSFSKLMSNTNTSPKQLRNDITSPNGTTYAGLKSLEQNKTKEIFEDSIKSAYDRAKQLQKQ